MRSGFLNASPSDSPASSSSSSAQEKGSRNKRKFRTDQQSSLPMPAPACADSGDGGRGDSGSSWTTDCRSLNGTDVGIAAGSIDSETCHSPLDHVHPVKPSSSSNTFAPNHGVKAADCPVGFQHYPYFKDDHEYEELQEPDWDHISEAQLEQMLMTLLDSKYMEAVQKIASYDYTQADALDALLRNGRDDPTSIVDNSLAWLQNSKAREELREPAFSDLKEMESYVLAEMICTLRKVRPVLSKGEAMWCLLMCDLNVSPARSMDDDTQSSSIKNATSPAIASSQSKAVSSPSLSNMPTTGVSLPQQAPRLPQSCVQSSGSLINSYKDNRSAFSAPSFSSSPVGKVAVACRQGNPDKSCVSRIPHNSAALLKSKSGNVIQEEEVQSANSPHQLLSARVLTPEEQTTKLGLYLPECSNGGQYVSKPHGLIPEHLGSDIGTAEVCSIFNTDKHTVQAPAVGVIPQSVENTIRGSLSGQAPGEGALQPDLPTSRVKCGKTLGPIVQLPGDGMDPVQTDLQIGNTTTFPGFQSLPREAWIDSDAPDNGNSLASTGTELSLATTSVAASGSTEVIGEVRAKNREEAPVNNPMHDVSISQILGCSELDGEERKPDMLWQLVDRVKELESQLQEWTEWAQQKVMQAARRLTKDTAELKTLRLEREEYMRLKKEKQALEESTMKKLSEMENALRKALSQVDRANTTARRLEVENAEVRAEMEAAKLTAAESVSVCQEATKREKKSMKKFQVWEKQKQKLQEELSEERRKLSSLMQQLSQAKERQQQAEVRWRQEKKAKEEALAYAEAEKRAKEQAERSAKRREEELQMKSEIESQRHRDDIQKLESEIARVKLSSGLQPSMIRWGSGFGSNNTDTSTAEKIKQINARLLSEISDLQDSQRDIHRDRECVMCMNEEMSVVFLPCAHQVVCVKCNDLHEKQGLRDCPSCRTPIQQRIRIYGVKS